MAFRAAPLSSARLVPRVTIGRVTPFIPCERPRTRCCRLFKATTAYISLCTDASAVLAPLLSRGTRVCHWQSVRTLWPDTRRLQLPLDDCCRLVLPYNAVHSIQQKEQIPNDPPRMRAKSTTTSNHPSTPFIVIWVFIRSNTVYTGQVVLFPILYKIQICVQI